VSHGKGKLKSGEQLAQTKDDDWMYIQPSEWEQTVTKWEKSKMNKYDEPGKGTMWRNEYATSSKHPLWKGNVVIPENRSGQKMDIAVWHNDAYINKEGKEVKEKWNVKITDKWEGNAEGNVSGYSAPPPKRENDDGVPW